MTDARDRSLTRRVLVAAIEELQELVDFLAFKGLETTSHRHEVARRVTRLNEFDRRGRE